MIMQPSTSLTFQVDSEVLNWEYMIIPQAYPRVEGEKFAGYLDTSRLAHQDYRIPKDELRQIINDGIDYANRKSSRVILNLTEKISKKARSELLQIEGKRLFDYFSKYYGDPASTAYECLGKHYSDIAKEHFRNRTLQKERMNSGWRYQYIAKECAMRSKKFLSVSDIGTTEADFTASIKIIEPKESVLNIYVSIKNRANTMGGQDWPKAIHALEQRAKLDKNRQGPYLCVFGIAMESGNRKGSKHSPNTEVWLSDFFWPFFSNYTYREVVNEVLETLEEKGNKTLEDSIVPKEMIDSFGNLCKKFDLLDNNGRFSDARKLVDLFVKFENEKIA